MIVMLLSGSPEGNKSSVAEPKLFIFGSDTGFGSAFVHNFGSGSSSISISIHILTLNTVDSPNSGQRT